MRNIIIAFCVLVAGIAIAATATFDGIRATSVTIGTNQPITTIIVDGTNYTGATVTIPPGPKGDTGATGPTSTNTEYIGYSFTSVVQNVSVTTNINSITTNYNAEDSSKWSTNQPFVSAFVWTNAGANSTTTNDGIITATINTNSGSASGGVTNHADLGGILGNGSIHLSEAEVSRIPSAWGSNTTAYLTAYGTNQSWQPVAVNYQNNLQVTWTHQTNFTYAGVVTQSFTVPNGVSVMQCKAWGGGGAGGVNYASGGAGGFAYSTVLVNSGDIIYMMVAQGGPKPAGTNHMVSAWPGGGYVVTNGSAAGSSGGGGGYTLVALNNITNVLCIAGGGGGGGGATSASGSGGAGGGSTGASGALASGGLSAPTGGTLLGPGIGGTCATPAQDGLAGIGRSGGNVTSTLATHGGAGGGGYFGGGSGSSTPAPSGGAGGSCYGQYYERGNNASDESYSGSWGVGGPVGSDGSSGAVVLRYYYNIP